MHGGSHAHGLSRGLGIPSSSHPQVALPRLGTTGRIHSHDNLPHNICTLSTLDFTHTWGQIQAKTFRSNPTPMHNRLFCMGWTYKELSQMEREHHIKVQCQDVHYETSEISFQISTMDRCGCTGGWDFLHTISLFKYYSKSISAFLNIFGYLLRWGTLWLSA